MNKFFLYCCLLVISNFSLSFRATNWQMRSRHRSSLAADINTPTTTPAESQPSITAEVSTTEVATTEVAKASPEAAVSTGPTYDIEVATDIPEGQYFCQCGECKSCYLVSYDIFMNRNGMRTKCSVCGKEWFQPTDKLLKVDQFVQLAHVSEKKVLEMKKIISEHTNPDNSPKFRPEKIELYVANLPYSYGEKELVDLFSEYGLLSVGLAKDQELKSKGFCFLEFASQADADRVVQEMNGYFCDPNRRLSVRYSTREAKSDVKFGDVETPRVYSYNSNNAGGGGGGRGGGGGGGRSWNTAAARTQNQ